MKKIISCVMLFVLSGLPAAALDGQAVENVVLEAQAVQQRKYTAWDSFQKKTFPYYLELAELVMRKKMYPSLNPKYLGAALFTSISLSMRLSKSSDGKEPLTKDEERAVFYAVSDYLPANNCEGMMKIKDYDERFQPRPIQNLNHFQESYYAAAKLVFQAVQDIANQTTGYEGWLEYLKDNPLIPAP